MRIKVFKGTPRVDIRQMFKKNGKKLPMKKGISLQADQWTALKRGLGKLNAAI